MRMEKAENCENCRFLYARVPGKTLICRRFPPSAQDSTLGRGNFPETQRPWWCGEWKGMEA